MFGPKSMNKALCGCGAIADLDTEVVQRKHVLGKQVECARCRNQRIAEEREALERHFQGLDDEKGEDPLLQPAFTGRLRCHRMKSR